MNEVQETDLAKEANAVQEANSVKEVNTAATPADSNSANSGALPTDKLSIGSISVAGNVSIKSDKVLAKVRCRVGQQFDDATAAEDAKRIAECPASNTAISIHCC